MSGSAGTPEPRLFFISHSGADADVALAVARLVEDAGQRAVLKNETISHQNLVAAMERAFAAADDGVVTVAILSAGYFASDECLAELDLALGRCTRLIGFRIGELSAGAGAQLGDPVDLQSVLSIEDDERRSEIFAETVLDALGISKSGTDDRLTQALNHEPLALELASRLLAERPSASIETYLEALAEHSVSAPAGRGYSGAMRAALLTSFEVVEGDAAMRGHSATSLIALAAHTPQGVVPLQALDAGREAYPAELGPFVTDPALRRKALDLLQRFSLVTATKQGYAVDPRIGEIVRDLLAEAGRTEEWKAASSLLNAGDGPAGRGQAKPASVPGQRSSPPSREKALEAFELGELLAKDGKTEDALSAFETARAAFQVLADTSRDDIQAQTDLAASHAKIGLAHIGAARMSDGERWLRSCRKLIVQLANREPENELWPRYLESLDSQLADIAGDKAPPKPPAVTVAPLPPGRETVRELVNALKEPLSEPLEPPTEALITEEPPPLVIEETRAPPKVFSDADAEPVALESEAIAVRSKRRILPLAVNGSDHESDALGPASEALGPPERKTGFLKRLFGR